MDLERRDLRIGMTPLTDAAPIVVALERGFFAPLEELAAAQRADA